MVPNATTWNLDAGDLYGYFYSSYAFETERLRTGALPFWNPYQGGGVPFLATLQPGALYPLRLLLLGLDVATFMACSTAFHVALTMLGTYAFCRTHAVRPGSAAVGAVVAAITVALPRIYGPPYLDASAWLFPTCALLVQVARDPRWRWTALAGVTAALPILAGGYQVAVYVAYGVALVTAALLLDARGTRCGAVLVRFVVVGLVAAGTAAPQLLPTVSWSAEAVRQTSGLADAQIQPFMSSGWSLLGRTFVRGPAYDPAFFSIPLALLALLGFVTRGRIGVAVALGAVGAYLFAIGPATPWFWLYRWIPAFGMFRLPARLLVLAFSFGAVGVAFGVACLAEAAARRRAWLGVLIEATALGLTIWLLVLPYENRVALPWVRPPEDLSGTTKLVAAGSRLGDGRLALPRGLAGMPMFGVRIGMVERVRVLEDYEPLSSRRLGDYLNAVVGDPPGTPRVKVMPFNGTGPLKPLLRPVLLDLVAADGFIAGVADTLPVRVPPFRAEGSNVAIALFRNPLALPRAYLVPSAHWVADESAALAAIVEPKFTGRDEAVVVGTPETPEELALAAGARHPFVAAHIAGDEPEHVTVAVSPTQTSLLVLADAWAPGWTAVVDGRPRAVRQTNHFVRGVVVQPGERTVEFRYVAPGFRAGVALAAAAWGIALALAWRSRRANPARPVSAPVRAA